MTERARKAEQAMLAICAAIELGALGGEELAFWVAELADILPDCRGCPDRLVPLRVAAEALVGAPTPARRLSAQRQIRRELGLYYAFVSADRVDAWRGVSA